MLVSSQHSLIKKGVSYDVWGQYDSYLHEANKPYRYSYNKRKFVE